MALLLLFSFFAALTPLALQAVNMLKQIRLDISPHRVKDKVHALPSGKLGSGDKITVTGNQNDLINLLLIRE